MQKKSTIFLFFALFSIVYVPTIQAINPVKKTTINVIEEKIPYVNKSDNVNVKVAVDIMPHISNNLTFVIDIKNKMSAVFNTSIKFIQSINLKMNFTQNINVTFNHMQKQILGFFNQTKKLVSDHKYKLLISSILGTYASICLVIAMIHQYLKQKHLWSNWKESMNFQELLAIPQQDLAQELATNIQAYYIDTNEPTNSFAPMTKFIQDIECELKKLTYFLKLFKIIDNLYVSKAFPFCEESQGEEYTLFK